MVHNQLEAKAKMVEYYGDVPVVKYAAMFAGVSRDTAFRWIKEDKAFKAELQEARAKWVQRRVKKTRAEFSLERLEKEAFAERKELTGAEGKDITLKIIDYGTDNKPTTETEGSSEEERE